MGFCPRIMAENPVIFSLNRTSIHFIFAMRMNTIILQCLRHKPLHLSFIQREMLAIYSFQLTSLSGESVLDPLNRGRDPYHIIGFTWFSSNSKECVGKSREYVAAFLVKSFFKYLNFCKGLVKLVHEFNEMGKMY